MCRGPSLVLPGPWLDKGSERLNASDSAALEGPGLVESRRTSGLNHFPHSCSHPGGGGADPPSRSEASIVTSEIIACFENAADEVDHTLKKKTPL